MPSRAEGEIRALEYTTHLRFDDLGLRGGGRRAPDAGDGPLRLLAVGDSFTLAAQVDEAEAWTTRLGALLTERGGRPVEVLNAGVDAYGTAQAAGRLDRLAEPTGADAALLLGIEEGDALGSTKSAPPAVGDGRRHI